MKQNFCSAVDALHASEISVDGIWFNFDSDNLTAEVTYQGSSVQKYSGAVVIPETVTYNDKTYTVTSIGEDAFYGCRGLTSVTIPNSVTSIGEDAFLYVPNIVYSGQATGSPWGAMSVNGYVEGWLVYKDSSKKELLACSTAVIGEITIPNSVTSIGDHAFHDFSNCSGLTSVTIGNNVTSIGDFAFSGCTGLTSVTIPNSVTSIEHDAFSGCSSLTSIEIPNSVTSIGSGAFCECSSLTSVTIPNSVKSIGEYAFCDCISLTSVTIPNSVTIIGGDAAFYGCSSLSKIISLP